jgi:hypothetical protein
MRRAALFVLGLILAAFALPPAALAAKRVALVIGIDSYPNLDAKQQLKKAVNDAEAVGKTLSELDFQVISGMNVTRPEFNRKLQDLARELEPDDVAAFFFSGHGVQVDNANYLLPSDIPEFQSGDEEVLTREAIGLDSILDMLEKKRTRINVVILDACRNNPFSDPKLRSGGGTRGLTLVEPPSGTFVMYSAGTNQTALDRLSEGDDNPNSVYTRNLLPLLKRPGLPIQSVAKRIQVEVRDLAKQVKHAQVPAYYDQVVGDFELNEGSQLASVDPSASEPKAADASPPQVTPAPPSDQVPAPSSADRRKQEGELAYLDCVRANSLDCYKKFLTDFADHSRAVQVEKIIRSQSETALYQACVDGTTASGRMTACQSYLDAFPDGQFASHANELLNEAKKALTAAVLPAPPPPPRPQPEEINLPPEEATSLPRPSRRGESCSHSGDALYCVSSVLASQQRNYYGPESAFDGNSNTAWVEGSGGQGIGDFMVLEFDAPRTVSKLTIRNGYAKNTDIYKKNSRVKDIEIRFSDGSSQDARLSDTPGVQTVTFDRPVRTNWVQIEIRSVYPGWKYSDTAINEVRVN